MAEQPIPSAASISPASDGVVVLKATLRAADRLKITNRALGRIIGLSDASVSRMRKGGFQLDKGKAFELALMFVRLYRSLDAIVGGDDAVAAAWLANRNTALDGVPIELIQSVAGLADVIGYLDARRALL